MQLSLKLDALYVSSVTLRPAGTLSEAGRWTSLFARDATLVSVFFRTPSITLRTMSYQSRSVRRSKGPSSASDLSGIGSTRKIFQNRLRVQIRASGRLEARIDERNIDRKLESWEAIAWHRIRPFSRTASLQKRPKCCVAAKRRDVPSADIAANSSA